MGKLRQIGWISPRLCRPALSESLIGNLVLNIWGLDSQMNPLPNADLVLACTLINWRSDRLEYFTSVGGKTLLIFPLGTFYRCRSGQSYMAAQQSYTSTSLTSVFVLFCFSPPLYTQYFLKGSLWSLSYLCRSPLKQSFVQKRLNE